MKKKDLTGVEIFAIVSLGVCGIVTLLSSGVFLYVLVSGSQLIASGEILVGFLSPEVAWILVLCMIAVYFLALSMMWGAVEGLLKRERAARSSALMSLSTILLISSFMSYYSLPYLWENYSAIESAWLLKITLFLLPGVMVLYSIWGLVQILVAKPA